MHKNLKTQNHQKIYIDIYVMSSTQRTSKKRISQNLGCFTKFGSLSHALTLIHLLQIAKPDAHNSIQLLQLSSSEEPCISLAHPQYAAADELQPPAQEAVVYPYSDPPGSWRVNVKSGYHRRRRLPPPLQVRQPRVAIVLAMHSEGPQLAGQVPHMCQASKSFMSKLNFHPFSTKKFYINIQKLKTKTSLKKH